MDEAPALRANLRDFIRSVDHIFREQKQLEDVKKLLLRLEETEENFNNLGLVKYILSKIDKRFGTMIEAEIERHSNIEESQIEASAKKSLSKEVVDKVFQSPEFGQLWWELHAELKPAIENLVINFEDEFGSPFDQSARKISWDSDSMTGSNQTGSGSGGLLLYGVDQFNQVAENLDKNQPLNIRISTLKNLIQVPTSELVTSEKWENLKSRIKDALEDTNEELSTCALHMCARGLNPANISSKDVFLLLLETILSLFSKKSIGSSLRDGFNLQIFENKKVVLIMQLMSRYQIQVTHYWLRYPVNRFLDDLIEGMVQLLTTSHGAASVIPLYLLAMVDYKANWFVNWMHGSFSRIPLIKSLGSHQSLIAKLMKFVTAYIQAPAHSNYRSACDRDGFFYSEMNMMHLNFLHASSILFTLVSYTEGQKLLLYQKSNGGSPTEMSIEKFLHLFVSYITSRKQQRDVGFDSDINPKMAVTKMIKRLCTNEAFCQKYICSATFLDNLLTPLRTWTNTLKYQTGLSNICYYIGEIMFSITQTDWGRDFLLNGSQEKQKVFTALHTVIIFTKTCLRRMQENRCPFQTPVVALFSFSCRNLATTPTGLSVVQSNDLHSILAAAWVSCNQELDRVPTPVVGSSLEMDTQIFQWEECLRYTLSGLFYTPKGLLLLQVSDALEGCMQHLYTEYFARASDQLTDRYDDLYLVTQAAASCGGSRALSNVGFSERFVSNLSNVLEMNSDFMLAPQPWPIEVLDKLLLKDFQLLASQLISYPALFEELSQKTNQNQQIIPVYNNRFLPTTIAHFLEYIIFSETHAKLVPLVDSEFTHAVGLRMLSLLVSCLDTQLFLETKFKFLEAFLQAQAQNRVDGQGEIIADMVSVERLHILVKCYVIGGPTERLLPSRAIDPGSKFKHTLFSSYPPPREYLASFHNRPMPRRERNGRATEIIDRMHMKGAISDFQAYRNTVIEQFIPILVNKPDSLDIRDMLLAFVRAMDTRFAEVRMTERELANYKLTDLEQRGVRLTINYGAHLNIFSSTTEATSHLTTLLKKVGVLLKRQQVSVDRNQSAMQLKFAQAHYKGFDWFTATVFMIFGLQDSSWKFLERFSRTLASIYLWPARGHASNHIPKRITNTGVPPLFYKICHQVQMVVTNELPDVQAAFLVNGLALSQIVQVWLRQCFWNYLDWTDIYHYIVISIVFGIDFQVYVCAAVLRAMRPDILKHAQRNDLLFFIKESPIENFRLLDHLEYMKGLQVKYREAIMGDLNKLAKP